jgi:hypothetical protein
LTALTIGQYYFSDRKVWSVREGLAPFVASTSMLRRLDIQGLALREKQAIEPLIEALRANRSIVNLAFRACAFTRDAADELSSLLRCRQASTTRLQLAADGETGRGDSRSLLGQSFHALTLCGGNQDQAVSILLASIGDVASMWRLCTLRMEDIDEEAELALTQLLPKLVHLKTLALSWRQRVFRGNHSNKLIEAFKKNESLTSVSFAVIHGEPNQTDYDVEVKTHAFCNRSAAEPSLLETAQEGGGSTDDRHFIAPLLFWVVQQAPKTARSKILVGLLVLNDGSKIGRRGHAEKRLQRSG